MLYMIFPELHIMGQGYISILIELLDHFWEYLEGRVMSVHGQAMDDEGIPRKSDPRLFSDLPFLRSYEVANGSNDCEGVDCSVLRSGELAEVLCCGRRYHADPQRFQCC